MEWNNPCKDLELRSFDPSSLHSNLLSTQAINIYVRSEKRHDPCQKSQCFSDRSHKRAIDPSKLMSSMTPLKGFSIDPIYQSSLK